jgi:phospholipid/cholesterol/gamma-HCH transport system substrate-binding protein
MSLPLAPLLKFLTFTVVVGLATTVLGLTIANAQGGARTSYSATFTDASGLLPGDDVRIAGVVVGSVDKVAIVDRRLAKVDFSVDATQPVPVSATAAILYKNLIGQRFLSLGQGTGLTGAMLKAGDTIPVAHTRPPLNLTTLFNGFQPLFAALDPQQVNSLSMEIVQVLQGEGGTVEALLASTSSLTNAIADRDQVIGQVVDNLNLVLQTINARDDQLSDLVTSLRQLVSGLAADRQPIGQAISSIGDLTQVTAGFLSDARPDLRSDIGALGDLSNQLDAGGPTIEKYLRTAPGKLSTIARAASYGSWFQFYLCSVDGRIGVGNLVPATNIPAFRSDSPRCGPDPSGTEGQSPPLVPGLPPLPSSLPSLPVVGPLLGGR